MFVLICANTAVEGVFFVGETIGLPFGDKKAFPSGEGGPLAVDEENKTLFLSNEVQSNTFLNGKLLQRLPCVRGAVSEADGGVV